MLLLNAVKSVLADFSSVSPSEQRGRALCYDEELMLETSANTLFTAFSISRSTLRWYIVPIVSNLVSRSSSLEAYVLTLPSWKWKFCSKTQPPEYVLMNKSSAVFLWEKLFYSWLKNWKKALSVLMLCTPVFIFSSSSSALLGRPRCGLSIWLSLLAIFNTLFWVSVNLFHEKTDKHESIQSWPCSYDIIRKWPLTFTVRELL